MNLFLSKTAVFLTCLIPFLGAHVMAADYRFDGSIPENVLRSYLARSMTQMYLLTGEGNFEDNLRMMTNCGVKFAGRSIYIWGNERGGASGLAARLETARKNANRIHAADPEIILQSCIFEIATKDVENLEIPSWVFEAFNKPVEHRHFSLAAMQYSSGRGKDHWGKNSCIPDVSQWETKFWFYYLAVNYINIGCEAIHWGQAELMNGNDPDSSHWSEVINAVRSYASKHARRHCIICDAHVPSGGLLRNGQLLFDFHSFPLRICEVPEQPRMGILKMDYKDSLYGRSKGGITPGGWPCKHLPYLVEFDNYGASSIPGQSGAGGFWVWGWDEITWFSQLPEQSRNDWLRYAHDWIRQHDSAGYLQMPGARCLVRTADGRRWYSVNQPSATFPDGFGQESTIQKLWMADELK